MMKLLYGTSNPAKLQHMKEMLFGLDIEIIGLDERKLLTDPIDESGNSPLENAKIKAKAYYHGAGIPVFSCDTGLYIDGLNDSEQPGVHVRRVNGKTLSDEEMIAYYASVADKFGGQTKAKYSNAICLMIDENNIFEYDGDDISSGAFLLTSKAHTKRTAGFPLDSLSINMQTGKYFIEMDVNEEREKQSIIADGFRNFFLRTILK